MDDILLYLLFLCNIYWYFTGPDLNKMMTYTPPDAKRITIVAGDMIGW